MGEVELLADLPVGQPLGGQLGDLELLRAEVVPCLWDAAGAGLAGGTEFLAGPFPPWDGAEGVEGFPGGAQWRP